MATVGIRALKQNASKVVADAAAGEPITVTDRGRPVAVLSGIRGSALDALIANGGARPALRAPGSLAHPPRVDGVRISDELAADRAESRF